jgi:hypothetical protein
VYNDSAVLAARLLQSLERQTRKVEIISIDNRDGRFSQAAAALNAGAANATGDWIVFAHQDVAFLSDRWAEHVEQRLESCPDIGWAGVAGFTATGRKVGLILGMASVWGAAFTGTLEVQTLDECVLIHRRQPGPYFDEEIGGWHAYGVDACCDALIRRFRNYVLDAPVWHDSKGTNVSGLRDAHHYVWLKHRGRIREIFTTCGAVPTQYGWGMTWLPGTYKRVKGRLISEGFRLLSIERAFRLGLWQVLEHLTAGEPVVNCWHGAAGCQVLEARGFVPFPDRPRAVSHRFGQAFVPHPGCHVFSAELDWGNVAPVLRDDVLRSRSILIRPYAGLREFIALCRQFELTRQAAVHLCMDYDRSRFIVVDLRPSRAR